MLLLHRGILLQAKHNLVSLLFEGSHFLFLRLPKALFESIKNTPDDLAGGTDGEAPFDIAICVNYARQDGNLRRRDFEIRCKRHQEGLALRIDAR